ncbi:MAG: LysM domain-containing protein [Anaerolineae bacterium]
MRLLLKIVVLLVLGNALISCSGNAPEAGVTLTMQALQPTATLVATSTLAPSDTTVSVTQATQVLVVSPTSSNTAAPPSDTPLPSETPGPFEYIIQPSDTLGFIIQQFGYTDFSTATGSIIDQIVRLNESIVNADILPAPGTVILIPRQTATPTPQNAETAVVIEATGTAVTSYLPDAGNIAEYVVQPDDTIVGIAQIYNTTLAVLFSLNTDLQGIFTCNPDIPSGGPGCNVTLSVGQVLKVPAPTPTPTLSPTPSGNETATPTPTRGAPMLLYPPEGANAQPGTFNLQWVSIGILNRDEFYLVQVTDITTNTVVLQAVTKNTAYALPENAIPTDGQLHTFLWRVVVAKRNADGAYGPIGGASLDRRFQMQSR